MSDTATLAVNGEVQFGEDHPVSRLEGEMFCEACGASMHRRPVWRTEAGGLLVVRCACGKLWPATVALPGRETWRRRISLALALGWVAAILGGVFAWLIIDMVLLDEIRWRDYGYRYEYDLARQSEKAFTLIPVGTILSLLGGVLVSACLYHWRKIWNVVLALAVPLLALGLYVSEPFRDEPVDDEMWLLLACMMAAGAVGVLVGRPVARAVIRMILPNRSRQYFAFLWRRDGKEVPAGRF